jgi:hypothetical protein
MRLRKSLAIILCLGFTMSCATSAQAGLLHAIIEKHKEKPNGLHAKLQEKKHQWKLAHPKKDPKQKHSLFHCHGKHKHQCHPSAPCGVH